MTEKPRRSKGPLIAVVIAIALVGLVATSVWQQRQPEAVGKAIAAGLMQNDQTADRIREHFRLSQQIETARQRNAELRQVADSMKRRQNAARNQPGSIEQADPGNTADSPTVDSAGDHGLEQLLSGLLSEPAVRPWLERHAPAYLDMDAADQRAARQAAADELRRLIKRS